MEKPWSWNHILRTGETDPLYIYGLWFSSLRLYGCWQERRRIDVPHGIAYSRHPFRSPLMTPVVPVHHVALQLRVELGNPRDDHERVEDHCVHKRWSKINYWYHCNEIHLLRFFVAKIICWDLCKKSFVGIFVTKINYPRADTIP